MNRSLSLLPPTQIVSHGYLALLMFQALPSPSLREATPILTTMKLLAVKLVGSTATLYLGRRPQNSMKMLEFHGPSSRIPITLTTTRWLGFLSSKMLKRDPI